LYTLEKKSDSLLTTDNKIVYVKR